MDQITPEATTSTDAPTQALGTSTTRPGRHSKAESSIRRMRATSRSPRLHQSVESMELLAGTSTTTAFCTTRSSLRPWVVTRKTSSATSLFRS